MCNDRIFEAVENIRILSIKHTNNAQLITKGLGFVHSLATLAVSFVNLSPAHSILVALSLMKHPGADEAGIAYQYRIEHM